MIEDDDNNNNLMFTAFRIESEFKRYMYECGEACLCENCAEKGEKYD